MATGSRRLLIVKDGRGMGFFIHRSRVQRLYRSLRRMAQTPDEIQELQDGFRSNMSVSLREAKRLMAEGDEQLKMLIRARGSQSLASASSPAPTFEQASSSTSNQQGEDQPPPAQVVWPWENPYYSGKTRD